jgi:DNA-binding transcriptional LysR family regulator
MNWEDIKIFLEVARAERLSVAAKRLSLDASTVSRRLHKLEQSLSAKLFERTVDGHQLTEQGHRLLQSARKMEHDANDVVDDIRHNQQENSGIVRIGVTEAFGSMFIAPNLLALQQTFPNIHIDLLHFSRSVKISRNEADIAITVEKPNSTSMIITKLCDYKLQLYAHPSYLARQSTPAQLADLEQHQWVSYIDNLLFTEQLSYLKELSEKLTPSFRATSVVSQYTAVKSGLGLGILPCFLAEQDQQLVKLFSKQINIVRSFYLVTHPESKRLSRVDSVWQYLKTLVQQQHRLLLPER